MPIYRFECKKCGYAEERITTSNSKTIPCTACGGIAGKVLSAGYFKINGYNEKNGYSNKGKR